jgi:hypothetical protein
VLAFAREHDRLDRLGQRREERLDAQHGRVVDGVALFRSRQPQERDLAAALGLERPRQLDIETAIRFGRAHGDPRGL